MIINASRFRHSSNPSGTVLSFAGDETFEHVMADMTSQVTAAQAALNLAASINKVSNDVAVQNFNQLVVAFTNSALSMSGPDDPRLPSLLAVGSNLVDLSQKLSDQINDASWFNWSTFFSNFPRDMASLLKRLATGVASSATDVLVAAIKPLAIAAGIVLVGLYILDRVKTQGRKS